MRRQSNVAVLSAVVGLSIVLSGCGKGGSGALTTSATSVISSFPSVTSAASQHCTTATTAKSASGAGDVSAPGDIPDNQTFVSYSPNDSSYSIKVPEGWARADSDKSVTFTDKLNSIKVEVSSSAMQPTVDSVKANELSQIASQVNCYEARSVTSVDRTAGKAVLITYGADSSPDPVTGKVVHDDVERYEFWKNGTQVVITLSAPKGSDNVDPWKTVTNSFVWKI